MLTCSDYDTGAPLPTSSTGRTIGAFAHLRVRVTFRPLEARHELDAWGEGGGRRTNVLRAVVVRPSTRRPRDDGAPGGGEDVFVSSLWLSV